MSLDPKGNQLLGALPPGEWQRWLPQLEHVEMPLGQVLYESGTTLSHVYFPSTSIVSLLYVMENGASAEIAVERRSCECYAVVKKEYDRLLPAGVAT